MKKLLFSIMTLATYGVVAQCTALTTAIPSGDTLHNTATGYHSSVAYHPIFDTYYSGNPGGSTANETFNNAGVSLGVSSTIDYRGIWYNPTSQLIEGNGWGGGLVENNLTSTGLLANTSSYIFGAEMPDVQSVGAFNAVDTIVYYYLLGDFYSFKRTSTGTTASTPITGISSFANISSKTIIYTGCLNKELGIYDYTSKQLFLINEMTGAVTATVDLPSASPNPNGLWGISYANGIFWLYDNIYNKWVGYNIFENNVGISETTQDFGQDINIYPNPTTGKVTFATKDISTSNESRIETIEIYNLSGQKVATYNNINTIDISNLSIGMYTARVVSDNKIAIKKIVKK